MTAATAQRPAAPVKFDAQPEFSEQRVILSNVSWTTYEALLADHQDRSAPRFTYDRGVLEIMSPLPAHEQRNWLLATMVDIVADETVIDILNLGSTTFRRQDLARGFEPDSCFYVQHAAAMRGKETIDLVTDLPPELIVEIDLTHSSIDKLPLYARLRIPEVWRASRAGITIYRLRAAGDGFDEVSSSPIFPVLTAMDLDRWLTEGLSHPRPEWKSAFRSWVQERLVEEGNVEVSCRD